jgi:hypothetical protein
MINDNISVKGVVSFVLKDAEGNIKEQHKHNLVVRTGLAYIVSRMKDASAGVMTHMGLGTSTVAAAATDTTLGAEVANSRALLASTTVVTTTFTNDSLQYVAAFPAGTATGALTEAGIFSASSGGTMLARTVYPVINKGSLDTLTITWKITVV